MKNQYFGDINDYLKYGILRALARETGMRTVVGWMLTADDDRGDGGKTGYLGQPGRWRKYDHELFDVLRGSVRGGGERDVAVAEDRELLPESVYHRDILTDDGPARAGYFHELEKLCAGRDLLFLDPDNGMEVKSTRKRNLGSSKYLYWDEAERFYGLGMSLLVFQHFPRVPRDAFITNLRNTFAERMACADAIPFVTASVVFFLVCQPGHVDPLRQAAATVTGSWRPHITVL